MAVRSAFVFLVLFAVSTAASAADIKPAGKVNDGWNDNKKLTLTGKIAAGDVDRIKAMLGEYEHAIIFMNSPGGDYQEGLALAKFFGEADIGTVVPNGSSCLSACAIAFLGGRSGAEDGMTVRARSVGTLARLGFHAPFIAVSEGTPTSQEIEAAYDHAIKTVTDFVRAADALGIDADVAADMMTPQRKQLFYPNNVRELVRVGIQLQDVQKVEKLTISMVRNLCINGWIWRDMDSASAAEAEMTRVIDDLKWQVDASTISIKTGYFSGDVVNGKRVVLPIAEGGEASGYYACVIDFVMLDDGLHVNNNGYLFAGAEDLMARAKKMDPSNPDSVVRAEIAAIHGAPAMNPLNRNAASDQETWAIVPDSTPLGEIADVVRNYLKTEPAL